MENNQNPVAQTEEKNEKASVDTPEVDSKDESKTEEKTFTQTEVNAMLLKERKKQPSKEDLKEFNEWKESKKTAEEKYAEVIEENKSLKKQVAESNNMTIVANAGVDSRFQKFVLSEVSNMEGEFEENLTSYLKSNSQFLSKKEEESKSTGIPQTNANTPVSDSKAYLDKKYANNPYYKK